MRLLRSLQMRVRSTFWRARAEDDLNAELEDYLAHEIDRHMAAGMSRPEAREAALRACGNLAVAGEDARSTWRWPVVETLLRDVRVSVRTLRRTPGFSLIAIAVMALCIGASTSLFTVVRSVLLRPLPFHDPDRLVMLYEHYRLADAPEDSPVSPGDYYDWRAQTNGFEDMAAWQWWQFNLSSDGGDTPETLTAAAATGNFFPLLGVQPALGRAFVEAEDSSSGSVALLTWGLFERRFGADPTIVGRQIHLDGRAYTVVGVLPRSFTYPDAKVQVWVPYQSVTPTQYLHHHAYHQSRVIARLKPGASLAGAVSQVSAVQYRLHRQYPDQAVSQGVTAKTLNDDLARHVKQPLILLMFAVLSVLLIGCPNVANLLVARGAARQKEVAIRGALGAGRLVLIREQMTESLVICLAGGLIGTWLSLISTQWFAHSWKDLPSAGAIQGDGWILAFAALLVGLAGIAAGLFPALSSTGKAVLGTLQISSRAIGGSVSHTALRQSLLSVEIAVTVVLLVAGGLLMKSFLYLQSIDPGCAKQNVLTLSYRLPKARYETPEKVIAFHEQLLDRVRALPGVIDAGLGETLPGAGDGEDDIFIVSEHPSASSRDEHADALIRRADPHYFQTLQIPLVGGRFFTRRDVLDQANKVIISRQLAQEYFRGDNPLGKHIEIPLWSDTRYEIVGIVGDTLHRAGRPSQATIYLPALSGPFSGPVLAIRTVSRPLAFAGAVQRQIASLDPQLPVSDVLTMEQVLGQSLGNASFSASVVLAFAVVSLVLASIGLYGVLSYLATQRATELGIRVALGARHEQILRLMLFQGLRPAFYGLVLGTFASIAAMRLVRSMLFGTQPLDPMVFAGVSVVLAVVATLACIVPAWDSSRLDPIRTLRSS